MSDDNDALLLREALSRLLADDLPPEEAARLRARIAQEPEVAQAWAELQALCGALDALPTALPPPPALDAAVLQAVAQQRGRYAAPQRSARWTPGTGWALAAAALLAVGAAGLIGRLPDGAPEALVLVSGAQVIEGAAVALETAQGERVVVSGRALVQVEPPARWLREERQLPSGEEGEMTRYLLAAGAGAALTVVVYEGTARITPAGGTEADTVTVTAGQQQTFSPLRRQQEAHTAPAAGGGGMGASAPDLEAELAALREEVAALRLERDLQSGALKAMAGEPQDWPESVPEAFREAAFSEGIRDLVASRPALELIGVDCEEFPCLAIVRDHSGDDAWMNTLRDAASEQWDGVEDLGMGMWISQDRSDEEGRAPVNLAGISILPPEGRAEEVSTRTDWRMQGWLADVSADLSPDNAPH